MNTITWHQPRTRFGKEPNIKAVPNEGLGAVATGVGAILCGAATGALAGAFFGPAGMGVGAGIGAFVGGLAGKRVAEMIDNAATIIPF